MSRFAKHFGDGKVIIGMVHLPPLPDYPDSPGIEQLTRHALQDIAVLENEGADGALIENEWDRPHRVAALPETVAAMTTITTAAVKSAANIRFGCEILLNDPRASLEVAKRAGASFIRTDYFVDHMSRPGYGEFTIDPDGLLEYRAAIDASEVLILADIQVKYAEMLEPRPISESAQLARDRGADAVVVTGDASGDAPSVRHLRDAAQGLPVLVGSGLTSGNAVTLLDACDGAIVGTSIMRDGKVDAASIGEIITSARAL
jgi:membrane complex biogenesis BtpA family protein